MAARQDQTLQIALIISALLIVTLGGFLIYVNRLRAEHLQQLASAKADKQQADSALRKNIDESNRLRTYIGYSPEEAFDGIEAKYNEEMATFGATLSEDIRSYRTVLASVFDENRRSSNEHQEAKEQIKGLSEKILALEAAKETQITKYQETLNKLKQDAASERNKFNEALADLEQKRGELATALQRQQLEEKRRTDAFREQIAKQKSEIEELENNLRRTIAKLPIENPTSEVADGSVISVDQRSGTALINLGSADKLRQQVTFSVYEQDATDAGKAEKKGSLEVIRLLGAHTAQVQITGDSLRDPILPGDWIYSQTWHRGAEIRFAFAGVIDIDGDGKSDVQMARNLIALNGAKIDAIQDEEGKIDGKISVDTRYLVLGDYPSTPGLEGLRTGWDNLSEDAQKYGVDTITLQQFLDQMGYRASDRTVVLGAGSRASDFIPGRSNFRSRSTTGLDGARGNIPQ